MAFENHGLGHKESKPATEKTRLITKLVGL
jgi:hypothetical protein